MQETGKLRSDRIAAWTMVFMVHALLGWTLLQVPAPLPDTGKTDSALDLVWIAGALPMPSTRHKPTQPIASTRTAKQSRLPSRQESPAPPIEQASTPTDATVLSAAFIQRAVEATAAQAPGSFTHDPFADRAARLPGRAANTFRMRPPPSLAERVARVGKLFGGGDDPCRSARDSINDLSQAGDSRELQHALDYEKRHCR